MIAVHSKRHQLPRNIVSVRVSNTAEDADENGDAEDLVHRAQTNKLLDAVPVLGPWHAGETTAGVPATRSFRPLLPVRTATYPSLAGQSAAVLRWLCRLARNRQGDVAGAEVTTDSLRREAGKAH